MWSQRGAAVSGDIVDSAFSIISIALKRRFTNPLLEQDGVHALFPSLTTHEAQCRKGATLASALQMSAVSMKLMLMHQLNSTQLNIITPPARELFVRTLLRRKAHLAVRVHALDAEYVVGVGICRSCT